MIFQEWGGDWKGHFHLNDAGEQDAGKSLRVQFIIHSPGLDWAWGMCRNSIYWDASAQCQPLTEQGKRTWQIAYGVWGGALALPVCIHQSWTKKKSGGTRQYAYRLICNACITDMMSCTDSAARTVKFDLGFYNRMITKGEVRRHNRMQSCTTYSQFNLFIINPRKSWLLHNVQRNETYK